jgi:hypothetical protein
VKHFKFFGFAILIAIVMALFEIQVEGGAGWAANLPTWRKTLHVPLLGMWQGYSGKPFTGYHLYFQLLTFLLPHTVFFYVKWDLKKELNILAFYVFFSTLEGIFWFILNPAWGWQKFKYGIPWYKEAWVLGMPAEYWLRFGAGAILYYFSQQDADTKTKAHRPPKL